MYVCMCFMVGNECKPKCVGDQLSTVCHEQTRCSVKAYSTTVNCHNILSIELFQNLLLEMVATETDHDHPRRFTQVSQCDPDGVQSIRRSTLVAGVSTQNSSSSALAAACSASLHTECCPVLLVSDAFSKPMHIVPPLSVDSDFLCVSGGEEIGIGHLPHYCVSTCTDGQLQDNQSTPSSSQVDPACVASSASVVYEVVHVCTQSTSDDVGGGNGCINVVTLCSAWRLTAADTDGTDSTDDLFMIPIEESRIGQYSTLHELVID